MSEKISKKKKPDDYINNKKFSKAVFEYVELCNKCEADGVSLPIVPNYIALGFNQIAQGLSHKPNFIGYSYRDEMVMDAVENCLKAIRNYNIEAATRSGNPNAFAYFTQICYWAFLRRIEKEKKQQEIKQKLVSTNYSVDLYTGHAYTTEDTHHIAHAAIETMRRKLQENEEFTDDEYVAVEELLPKKRIRKTNDSDLMEFL